MKTLLALWIITLLISFAGGYFTSTIGTEKHDKQYAKQKVETKKKTTTMKEIVYVNKSGKLFCPPCSKRHCLVVPPVQLFRSPTMSRSCSDIEEELVDLQEKYEDIKKFCDPACPEYLDRTSRELISCMTDLQAVTGSSRYDDSIYFP